MRTEVLSKTQLSNVLWQPQDNKRNIFTYVSFLMLFFFFFLSLLFSRHQSRTTFKKKCGSLTSAVIKCITVWTPFVSIMSAGIMIMLRVQPLLLSWNYSEKSHDTTAIYSTTFTWLRMNFKEKLTTHMKEKRARTKYNFLLKENFINRLLFLRTWHHSCSVNLGKKTINMQRIEKDFQSVHQDLHHFSL